MPASSAPPLTPLPAQLAAAGRPRAYPAILLTLAFASNVFAGLVSTLMSAYLPATVRDLLGTTDPAEVAHVGSWVGSQFLVGWALGGMLLGWAGDRLGRVKVFTAAVLIYAVFTLAASWAPDWRLLTACRFLAGLGVGATLVLSAVVVAEAWEERTRAIALGIVAVGFPIGIISAGVVSYSVESWRTAFLAGAAPLVVALLCGALVRESETWRRLRSGTAGYADGHIPGPTSRAAARSLVVGATIFGAMLVGLWATFSWIPTWVQSLATPGAGRGEPGLVMMLLGMGGILGGAFSGLLANTLGRRRSLLICFAGCFVASLLLFRTNAVFSPIIYAETAFLAVFFGISQGILTAYIPELFPTAVRATATGVCFNVGRLVTAAAVFFVGVLVPLLGGYGSAIFASSATYLVGLVATLFGRETRGARL